MNYNDALRFVRRRWQTFAAGAALIAILVAILTDQLKLETAATLGLLAAAWAGIDLRPRKDKGNDEPQT